MLVTDKRSEERVCLCVWLVRWHGYQLQFLLLLGCYMFFQLLSQDVTQPHCDELCIVSVSAGLVVAELYSECNRRAA